MTVIDTTYGVGFTCDFCGDQFIPEPLAVGSSAWEFKEIWVEAKDAGWRAIKDAKGGWQHRCPDCPGHA